MKCRNCHNEVTNVFCDLNSCPPSNAMLSAEGLNQPELYFPLKVFVCDQCWLVQIDEVEKASNIFNEEYTYFSSYSSSWLEHSRKYCDMMEHRFSLNGESLVVEVASNDGYLLQYFRDKNIPVLGIEPTANTAEVAISKGIETITEFFGEKLARIEKISGKADLLMGNNVLAHVPDINDFAKGVSIALKNTGIATFEFPHLCELHKNIQFDTIYHEHFSYLSLTSVKSLFEKFGLELFDVEQLETHGGSLRIFLQKKEYSVHPVNESVAFLLNFEKESGVTNIDYYLGFQEKVDQIRYEFIQFLLDARKKSLKVIAYGAAAKGNTLLNYCGVKGNDLIEYVVDASPYKQGKFLPGSRIPVLKEKSIITTKPDYIVIFPWNLEKEITAQLSYCREWGCKFVLAIPNLRII